MLVMPLLTCKLYLPSVGGRFYMPLLIMFLALDCSIRDSNETFFISSSKKLASRGATPNVFLLTVSWTSTEKSRVSIATQLPSGVVQTACTPRLTSAWKVRQPRGFRLSICGPPYPLAVSEASWLLRNIISPSWSLGYYMFISLMPAWKPLVAFRLTLNASFAVASTTFPFAALCLLSLCVK